LRIDIVVVYIQRYERGHEIDFVPPITGIHLAAITPERHRVRVIHQQVEPVDLDTDADLVALSFFSGFAPEAYRLATELRRRGKLVVAGGPHATFSPDEVLRFCDSVVTGEAESVWTTMLDDAEAGRLAPRYQGEPSSMEGLPTPRYDLLPKRYVVARVLQATRGCPFTCSFCTVPTLNPGFRMRPIDDVVRDIAYDDFAYWWQRKVVWFWDDNLTIQRDYVRELLTRMVPLKRWWLTQASMDIAKDSPLLDLMRASGCIGIFFGIESFGESSLEDAHKRQNRVAEYRERIEALHQRGICVMSGFIAGFDGDTPESVRAMARKLYEIGVDVPFLSILTPYRGTALHKKLEAEGRILDGRGWEHYNGYNVAFAPNRMTPESLLETHRALWREAFSIRYTVKRVVRALFRLRLGAFLMCACMNLFYCLKALTGNTPAVFEADQRYAAYRALPSECVEPPVRPGRRMRRHAQAPEGDTSGDNPIPPGAAA
jgi:radical SAM superfamily enzyme YgiQ (UPF0313 family)